MDRSITEADGRRDCQELPLSGKDLLTNAGTVSAEIAKQKADTEYDKYQKRIQYELSPVEIHFIESFEKEVKQLKK